MPSPPDLPERLLVAVGGNATHPPEIRGTAEEQAAIAAATGRALLPLLQLKNELIITHGNGPVVGKILMRQAISSEQVTPMTLDICVAHSQGGIAYLLMQAFENALRRAGDPRHVVCLLTPGRGRPRGSGLRRADEVRGLHLHGRRSRAV